MNKIYSKVWNRELGQLVVASELASSDSAGATTGAGRGQALRLNALALALLTGGWYAGAQAATYTDAASGTVCSAAGTPAVGATAWTCQVPNGSGGYAIISKVANLAGGVPDFAGLAAKVVGGNAVAIGTSGVDYTRATGANTIAIGNQAWATTSSSVAVGDNARAIGMTSTAIGFQTSAEGLYAVALGSGAKALGDRSYALGNNALARTGDVAVGAGALTDSTVSAAAKITGKFGETTAIGYNAGLGANDV